MLHEDVPCATLEAAVRAYTRNAEGAFVNDEAVRTDFVILADSPEDVQVVQTAVQVTKPVSIRSGMAGVKAAVRCDTSGPCIVIATGDPAFHVGMYSLHITGARGGTLFTLPTQCFAPWVAAHMATRRAGAIVVDTSGLSAEDCVFEGNSNTNSGGAVKATSSELSFRNTLFVANTVEVKGGAVSTTGGSITISGCRFERNRAAAAAGALELDFCITAVDDTQFVANAVTGAASMGGALTITGDWANLFTRCTFDGNSAARGGAVYTQGNSPFFDTSTFRSNVANLTGGAVLFDVSSSPSLQRCAFDSNTAVAGDGGAIVCTECAAVSLRASTLQRNRAAFSGGAVKLEFVEDAGTYVVCCACTPWRQGLRQFGCLSARQEEQ